MAVVTGLGGSVSGVTIVDNVTQWSITMTAESIDTTDMDATNSYRTRIGGIKDWSGSYTALVDSLAFANYDTDLGAIAATAVFSLATTGTDSTLTGAIVVTDVAVTATLDNAIEAVFSFDGAGPITILSGS